MIIKSYGFRIGRSALTLAYPIYFYDAAGSHMHPVPFLPHLLQQLELELVPILVFLIPTALSRSSSMCSLRPKIYS